MRSNLEGVPGADRVDLPRVGRGTAIVVDDHHRMRRSGSELLQRCLPDFEVQEVPDAESALAAARVRRPDLVLMDVHLPGIDGLEATRRILELAPDAMVIVVSLADDWRLFRLALEAGARAFIPKSDLLDRLPPLIARLAEPLRGPSAP